jgi:hypothetical protein
MGPTSEHVDGMYNLPLDRISELYGLSSPLRILPLAICRTLFYFFLFHAHLNIQIRYTVMYSHIHAHYSLQLHLNVTPFSIVSVP